MEQLPLEITTAICYYLDHRGLTGFAAASKRCNQAARPVLFAKLHISFTTPAALVVRISDILDNLRRGQPDTFASALQAIMLILHS